MVIEIKVYGTPAPQGSKSFKGMAGDHAILAESSKKVKPWRESVKQAVLLAYPFGSRADAILIRGPVNMEITFTMPRPKSAKRGALPSTRPDLSKLVRSTEDALTEIGVYEDDSRIVETLSRKVYPGGHADSLDVPGVVIRLHAVKDL
jgi:crossover junction endodeoxyribonuclease RusA